MSTESESPTTSTRWKKDETTSPKFGFYSKEELLDLFMPKDEIPTNFKVWDAITSSSPIDPINRGKLFKIPSHAKINPSGFLFARNRGGKVRGVAKRGGRGTTPGSGIKGTRQDVSESLETQPSFDSESEWFYKDKQGSVSHGPYQLEKLIEWVESGFHSSDLEVKQEGQDRFIKIGEIINRLAKNKPEKQVIHVPESLEDELSEEEEEEASPEPPSPVKVKEPENFFSNVNVKFAQHDPWSGNPIETTPLSVTDLEKSLKKEIAVKAQETQDNERKIKFELERKAHLELEQKKKDEKKKADDKKKVDEKKALEKETDRLKALKLKEQKPETNSVGILSNPGPVWGGNQVSSTPMSLKQIQDEQQRQNKAEKLEKKKEMDSKPKPQSNAWGVVQTTIIPFDEIQKQEKVKKETASGWTKGEPTTTKKDSAPKSAWGTGTNVVATPTNFATIQQEESKKKKPEKSKITESNSTSVWAKTEPVEKKKKEKSVVAPVSDLVDKTPEKTESFWDEDKDTSAFSTHKPTEKSVVDVKSTTPKKKETKEPKKKEATGPTYASSLNKQSAPKKGQKMGESDFPTLKGEGSLDDDAALFEIAKPSKTKQLNIFGGMDVSDSFKEWYKKQMSYLGRTYDLTLLYYLLSLKTKKETDDYVFEYLGTSDLSVKFASDFSKLKDIEAGIKVKK